jgi:ABC-type branched-subunit amino acid transport system substrate-binding protein
MLTSARRVALLLLCLAAGPALAQPVTAERLPSAEEAFQNGLDRFRAGDYEAAYGLFRRAASDGAYHDRTTAALLMAARAAYADADFERAVSSATTLVSSYPGSRYAEDARRLIAQAASGSGQGTPIELGIILPAEGPDGYLGQALFNGVRIAVDQHNATQPRRPVRMIFRETQGTGPGAASALRATVEAGADAVIGPLFSDEAMAAAPAAEEMGVPLLAPLATDEAVSTGRRFVFQANPTFPARGRAMARYAVGRLGLRQLGVVSQTGTFGTDMGASFATEARRLGATIAFERQLPSPADWPNLDRRVGADALQNVQAVYLPVTGGEAPEHAAEALTVLDALRRSPRPLGNAEWEGLTGSRARASRLGAVFTQDFFVLPGAADVFGRRYQQLSGLGPDRIALIGYDTAAFLIEQAAAGGEGSIADRLRAAPTFQGIGHRLSFRGSQLNEALFILGYRDGEAVLLE